MEILDSTVADVVAVAALPSAERTSAWERVEAAHADTFGAYYGMYGDPSRRDDAIASLDSLAPQLEERAAAMTAALASAEKALRELGFLPLGYDVPIALLVGVGASDAWVTLHHGGPALFCALEQIEPERADVLAAHEMTHVAHLLAVGEALADRPELEASAGMLSWAEGVAVVASERVAPRRPEREYLMVPDDDWAARCEAALPELRAALGVDPLHPDEGHLVATWAAGGATAAGSPWPDRVGYWLGRQAVTAALADGLTLPEVLALSPEGIAERLTAALTACSR